jgi:hypothetical protein
MTVLACVQAWAPSTTTTWRHLTTRLVLRTPRPGCKYTIEHKQSHSHNNTATHEENLLTRQG